MEMKEKSWDRAERYPQSLLNDLTPVSEAELLKEYFEIFDDLADRYYPHGAAETHCIEMMATAMWCERRAISAETIAYSLDFEDQYKPEQGMRQMRPDGFSAAEQMALAIDRMLRHSDFLNFLLRYKKAQVRLYEMNLRRLKELKEDRDKYLPESKKQNERDDRLSDNLVNRLQAFNNRQQDAA